MGNVKEVAVYDLSIAMVPPAGVAADLSHLEGSVKVKGYAGELNQPPANFMGEALTGCSLVLIPAGMPRKPGQTRDDLFKINADIAKGIVEACAKFCPNAVLGLIVNPVNSIVPAMAELYKKKGLDPLKCVGVTTLDTVRANKFVAEVTGKPVSDIQIPVVGGHAGKSILPLFSQDPVGATLSEEQIKKLDPRVQDGGTEVVEAKGGKGSATLSMAYAGSRFGYAVLNGLGGTPTTECAYVMSNVVPDLPYFSSKVTFGVNGVEKVHEIGPMSDHEKSRFAEASAQLKIEVQKGL